MHSDFNSTMEILYGSYWGLELLASFILTWLIGLTPPIVIRFIIARKPLPRCWAIVLAAMFLIMNIEIFTMLGSRSNTHTALCLVPWVSYLVLRRKSREK